MLWQWSRWQLSRKEKYCAQVTSKNPCWIVCHEINAGFLVSFPPLVKMCALKKGEKIQRHRGWHLSWCLLAEEIPLYWRGKSFQLRLILDTKVMTLVPGYAVFSVLLSLHCWWRGICASFSLAGFHYFITLKCHLLTDVSRKRNAVWVNLFSVWGFFVKTSG